MSNIDHGSAVLTPAPHSASRFSAHGAGHSHTGIAQTTPVVASSAEIGNLAENRSFRLPRARCFIRLMASQIVKYRRASHIGVHWLQKSIELIPMAEINEA
jgi:hypothetical protein